MQTSLLDCAAADASAAEASLFVDASGLECLPRVVVLVEQIA